MTNDRFQSMYALWTILSFNMLLTGNFSKLDDFVMATWSNDIAVGINQDAVRVPAMRIDNATDLTVGAVFSEESPVHRLGVGQNFAFMTVAECGGEQDEQEWIFDSGALTNAGSKTCIGLPDRVHTPTLLAYLPYTV